MTEIGTLEITTKIGCSVYCKHCPQNVLIDSYKSDIMDMSFDTFSRCIDKLPSGYRVDFSGMCEPFLNPLCVDFLCYIKDTHMVSLFTTMQGLTLDGLRRLVGVPFYPMVIHVADANQNSKIDVNDEYIKKLKFVSQNFNCEYMSHGNPHPQVIDIIGSCAHIAVMDNPVTRAGNVDCLSPVFTTSPIICRSSGDLLNRNGLLPNGDVVVCCMDYSLTNILGNLLRSSYEEIFNSTIKKTLIDNTKSYDKMCICRKCENITFRMDIE